MVGLADPDDRAPLGHHELPFEQADEVLLEARTRGGVAQRAGLPLLVDLPERLADADEPGHHERVGGQRAAGRVDLDVVAQPEGARAGSAPRG